MEWHFNLLAEHGVLSVKTSGDLDYDTMLEFISDGAAEMQRHGCEKILDVMHNNGLPHCLFSDPDAALDWLLDRKSAT